MPQHRCMTLAVSPKPESFLTLSKVRQLCDNEIQEAFLRVQDIADVEVFGGYVPEISVNIDRDRLTRFGFSVDNVIAAITAQNRNIPSGLLIRKTDELMIKIQGERSQRHELADIVIGQSKGSAVLPERYCRHYHIP